MSAPIPTHVWILSLGITNPAQYDLQPLGFTDGDGERFFAGYRSSKTAQRAIRKIKIRRERERDAERGRVMAYTRLSWQDAMETVHRGGGVDYLALEPFLGREYRTFYAAGPANYS